MADGLETVQPRASNGAPGRQQTMSGGQGNDEGNGESKGKGKGEGKGEGEGEGKGKGKWKGKPGNGEG